MAELFKKVIIGLIVVLMAFGLFLGFVYTLQIIGNGTAYCSSYGQTLKVQTFWSLLNGCQVVDNNTMIPLQEYLDKNGMK